MLKKVVEQLVNQPQLLEQFKKGNLHLDGISETEKASIIDVLSEKESKGIDMRNSYWK